LRKAGLACERCSLTMTSLNFLKSLASKVTPYSPANTISFCVRPYITMICITKHQNTIYILLEIVERKGTGVFEISIFS
jgi:hypothetical protein